MRRWLALSLALLVCAATGFSGQGSQKKRPPAAPTAAEAPAAPKAAQTSPQFGKHPLEDLKILGSRRISREKIIAASGLKIGQLVDRADFDAARTRLLDTGAFESAGFDFQPGKSGTGFDATLEVVEVAQMFPMEFEDLPASDDVLKAAISRKMPIFSGEIPATRPILDRCERALVEALDGKVMVEGHMVATLHGGDPKIVFRPPGTRPRISEVHFSGNELIPASKLAVTFAEAAIGTEFKDLPVRTLLDRSIRPLYEAKGHVRVAFTKVVAEKSTEPGVDAVAVTVALDEGPEFKLGQIHYAGGAERDLAKTAGLREGDLADFDIVKEAQDRIVQKFRSTGYLHASGKQDRTVHDKELTVDLLITVEPGAQFAFGKLTIEGLDLIGEPAIRKMWGDREGKPFDPNFPEAFLKDIRDEGLFDNLGKTSSSAKVNEETKIVDVTLTFGGTKGDGGRDRRRQPF
jgi:outer membrane protein insertion porin family